MKHISFNSPGEISEQAKKKTRILRWHIKNNSHIPVIMMTFPIKINILEIIL